MPKPTKNQVAETTQVGSDRSARDSGRGAVRLRSVLAWLSASKPPSPRYHHSASLPICWLLHGNHFGSSSGAGDELENSPLLGRRAATSQRNRYVIDV